MLQRVEATGIAYDQPMKPACGRDHFNMSARSPAGSSISLVELMLTRLVHILIQPLPGYESVVFLFTFVAFFAHSLRAAAAFCTLESVTLLHSFFSGPLTLGGGGLVPSWHRFDKSRVSTTPLISHPDSRVKAKHIICR